MLTFVQTNERGSSSQTSSVIILSVLFPHISNSFGLSGGPWPPRGSPTSSGSTNDTKVAKVRRSGQGVATLSGLCIGP